MVVITRIFTLLPCPFCGGEARIHTMRSGNKFVKCQRCEAMSGTMESCQDYEVAAVWNRREPTKVKVK